MFIVKVRIVFTILMSLIRICDIQLCFHFILCTFNIIIFNISIIVENILYTYIL